MRLGRCLDLCLEINLPEPPITSKEKTINQSASCEYYPRRAAKKPFYKGGTFVPRNARVGSAPNCWHRPINDRFYNYERIQLIAGQTPFKIRCLSSYRQELFCPSTWVPHLITFFPNGGCFSSSIQANRIKPP
jgi:hypothetical protein